MSRRHLLILLTGAIAGCAALPGQDPLRVTLAGIEGLPGAGLEVRFAVKLRVQNPNDTTIDFDGVAINLEVRGMDLGSGVSDAKGSIPRFGETLLTIPVTVSAFALVRQGLSFATGDRSKVTFVASGKLGGTGFGSMRFKTQGEFEIPSAAAPAPASPSP
jgi:Late embryogenesis abundant protein